MNQGFIKLIRSAETLELLNDPSAFVLLTVIALRARRSNEFNIHNLKSSEALIGDYRKFGLTRQQYRTAMKRLGQWGFAAFKPTTRGTVATLCDARIYNINIACEQPSNNHQTANDQPTGNHQPTTNKNEKKEKNEKKYSPHSDEWRFAELLAQLIVERKPDFRRPELGQWAGEIDRMIRLAQEVEL